MDSGDHLLSDGSHARLPLKIHIKKMQNQDRAVVPKPLISAHEDVNLGPYSLIQFMLRVMEEIRISRNFNHSLPELLARCGPRAPAPPQKPHCVRGGHRSTQRFIFELYNLSMYLRVRLRLWTVGDVFERELDGNIIRVYQFLRG
ncbi:hypothetical protein EVAR_101886_1 [Eumeta japonica]|uniref:Uncharacterized protein n=1 Tax=Eumeta variegata TaxID=151549 RepID=A0A4C1SN52_EUMVA|nr:hypothetical protein EVAR_101886_1 [Eumeta japonica]